MDDMYINEKIRQRRKILIYWSILYKAGYEVNETALEKILNGFDPKYSKKLRQAIYESDSPPPINSLEDLKIEYEQMAKFIREIEYRGRDEQYNNKYEEKRKLLFSDSGNPLFDSDEKSLLEFLEPPKGRSGTKIIQPFKKYHNKNGDNFVKEILKLLDDGKTIIIDLSNSDSTVRMYFSTELSEKIFSHQVEKFTNNSLKREDGINHYIQLYFEEAHHLFPAKEVKEDIYTQIAKEGAKYNIGMVYSTQSLTTIHSDLLNQTENFFIFHLSSQNEVETLSKINFAFEDLQREILQSKTQGYVRMLTRSHRFVIPVQTKKFQPIQKELS
jgi:DNA helicase HerA-like ATPase